MKDVIFKEVTNFGSSQIGKVLFEERFSFMKISKYRKYKDAKSSHT
jgi:hypothetical protein